MVSGATAYLMLAHGFWGGKEWSASPVVADMCVPGLQQLAKPKVCK